MKFTLLFLAALVGVVAAHGHGGHKGFKAIWKELTEEQKTHLKELLQQDKPRGELKKDVEQWVESSNDEKLKSVYQKFQEAKKQWKEKKEAKVQELLAKETTPDLKNAYEQLRNIWADESLTKKQTCEKIQEVRKSATEDVQKKLHLHEHDCSKPWHFGKHHRHHQDEAALPVESDSDAEAN